MEGKRIGIVSQFYIPSERSSCEHGCIRESGRELVS